MVRTLFKLAATASVTVFVLWALMLMGPDFEARVESKVDSVHVRQQSGMWYHEYRVTARRVREVPSASDGENPESSDRDEPIAPVAATSVDTSALERVTFRASEAQFDLLRTGQRLRMHRLPLVSSFAWVVDESVLLGALQALGARIVQYQTPRSIAPMLGRTPGLARVLSVHRVIPRRGALEWGGTDAANAPNAAFEVIVVEFWAQRRRTLVRTADVVDARSIGDLGPGQILQMHYDPSMPRIMRLDDGMRTHVP